MRDNELTVEILHQIHESAQKVVQRFQIISKPNDFTDTSTGVEKMDAICMMLIVIGESLKKLDKVTDNKLLSKYPGVDWKKAKGMRDIITHHYADINAETVFFTCKKKIPGLLETIQKIYPHRSQNCIQVQHIGYKMISPGAVPLTALFLSFFADQTIS